MIDMTPTTSERRLEDEAACARLCVDFARHIDARRYGDLLDLFTEDGVLDRMGRVMRGQQEIASFLYSRPLDVATRHLCTNLRVDVHGDDADGSCSVLFFRSEGAAGEPFKASVPVIVDYQDRYKRTADGWRIVERRIRPVLHV